MTNAGLVIILNEPSGVGSRTYGKVVGLSLHIYETMLHPYLAGPAHDLLKILLSASDTAGQAKSQQRPTMLLPFVKDFVPSIDLDNHLIHISPPTGLLELAMGPASTGKQGAGSKSRKAKRSTKKQELLT